MAWTEGRSRKHETDIFDMMYFHYSGADPDQSAGFDESIIDLGAARLGIDSVQLWQKIKLAAWQQANRGEA